jgi:hypothetical protein
MVPLATPDSCRTIPGLVKSSAYRWQRLVVVVGVRRPGGRSTVDHVDRVAPGWGLEESNAGAKCEICFSGMCRVRSPVSCVSVFHSGGGRPERVSTRAESVKARSSE